MIAQAGGGDQQGEKQREIQIEDTNAAEEGRREMSKSVAR